MQQQDRFVYLDMGRAIACVLVVLYHAAGTASSAKYFGAHPFGDVLAVSYIRMPFFFAMSGFLLSWFYLSPQASAKPASARGFLVKRALRIYPLYWFAFGLVAAMSLLLLKNRDAVPGGWNLIQSLALLPQQPDGSDAVAGTKPLLIYPAWVLQYEMAAFLLVALAIWHPRARQAYLFAFPVFFLLWHDSEAFALNFVGSKWLLIFWLGAIAAQLAQRMETAHLRRALVLSVAWLVVCASGHYAMVLRNSADLDGMDLWYGAGFALLMIGMSRFRGPPSLASRGSFDRSIAKLALWSYAIFVFHAPVISLVCKLLVALGLDGESGWVAAVIASLIASVAAGALVHQLLEMPAQRYLARKLRVGPPLRAKGAPV